MQLFLIVLLISFELFAQNIWCLPNSSGRGSRARMPPSRTTKPDQQLYEIVNSQNLDACKVPFTYPQVYELEKGKYLVQDLNSHLYKSVIEQPELLRNQLMTQEPARALLFNHLSQRFPDKFSNGSSLNSLIKTVAKHVMMIHGHVPQNEPSVAPFHDKTDSEFRLLYPYLREYNKRYYLDIIKMLLGFDVLNEPYDFDNSSDLVRIVQQTLLYLSAYEHHYHMLASMQNN